MLLLSCGLGFVQVVEAHCVWEKVKLQVTGPNRDKLKVLLVLHLLLVLFSFSGIMSKLAAGYDFMSLGFVLCYGGMLCLLGVYAIGWQQVIKRLPLTTAYANRAITVVWGLVWGALLFNESITAPKVVGALVVLAGVVLYATAGDDEHGDSVYVQTDGGEGV